MFRLRAWYLDCVSEAGDAFLGRSARLSWDGLRVRGSAMLVAPHGGSAEERHSLVPGAEPRTLRNGLSWRCEPVDVEGTWRSRTAPIGRTLLGGHAGALEWACLAPSATARVRAGGAMVDGLGYAECLTLTLDPQELPFRTFFRGRFVAPGASLIWIVWDGVVNAHFVFLDGRDGPVAQLSPDRIAGEDGTTMQLEQAHVLQRESALCAALPTLPELAGRPHVPFLTSREETRLRRGTLLRPGKEPTSGWVVEQELDLR
jgi:hypothetical protein